MSQSKTLSKVVFGVGIIAVGLLFLAVALIIGLQFPKHVEKRMITELCVLDSEYILYDEWVSFQTCFICLDLDRTLPLVTSSHKRQSIFRH